MYWLSVRPSNSRALSGWNGAVRGMPVSSPCKDSFRRPSRSNHVSFGSAAASPAGNSLRTGGNAGRRFALTLATTAGRPVGTGIFFTPKLITGGVAPSLLWVNLGRKCVQTLNKSVRFQGIVRHLYERKNPAQWPGFSFLGAGINLRSAPCFPVSTEPDGRNCPHLCFLFQSAVQDFQEHHKGQKSL